MPQSSPHHQPHSNRPPHHNRTSQTAFTNTVRQTLDAPLPPTPPSSSLLSPSSSSCSSSSNPSPDPPRFRNSAPLPRRGNAVHRPSTPNAYSAPLTPPSPFVNSSSPNTSSPATTLIEEETLLPSRAFADARESPPSLQSQRFPKSHPHRTNISEEEEVTLRPSPAHTVTISSRPAPSLQLSGQSAKFRRPSALPPSNPPTNPPPPSLPNDLEHLYLSLGIIPSLPSSSPRDHLSSIEAMNDAIAIWGASNPVASMHIAALAGRLGVRARYEGTLAMGGGEEWMVRRGLAKRDGKGASFRERVRRMGEAGAGRKGSLKGWRDLPLVVVLLYSEMCGVDVTRMGDREGKAMLADWASRYWPVSDEAMVEVMMEWGSEIGGKVDIDPRRSIREDAGGVERVIERIRALGEGDVRRGGSLAERLAMAGGARRSGSVRTAKK